MFASNHKLVDYRGLTVATESRQFDLQLATNCPLAAHKPPVSCSPACCQLLTSCSPSAHQPLPTARQRKTAVMRTRWMLQPTWQSTWRCYRTSPLMLKAGTTKRRCVRPAGSSPADCLSCLACTSLVLPALNMPFLCSALAAYASGITARYLCNTQHVHM